MVRAPDAGALWERASGVLLASEAENCLMIGLLERLRQDPHAYGDADPYLATVEVDGRLAGLALCTPPFSVTVTRMPALVAPALLDDAGAALGELRGLSGPVPTAGELASAYSQATGSEARLEMAQRIHAADHVVAPRDVPGRSRVAHKEDRDLLLAWLRDFIEEAMGPEAPNDPVRTVDRALAGDPGHGLQLWEHDGSPVSMAGWTGPTPNGIRVGPVYTPPELRGRGYGGANVADLSSRLLSQGRRFCYLFTDLANPISNDLYARLGYRPVCDFDLYRFEHG